MAAVADTSPLIFLAKVHRLTLLRELYREVFVPPAVAMELRAKPDTIPPELDRFDCDTLPEYPHAARTAEI
jgi:predicted nucleic acid-binding protein